MGSMSRTGDDEVNSTSNINESEAISPEKEAKYRKIFERLDFDSDGRIGVEELKKSLKENGIRGGFPGHAEVLVTYLFKFLTYSFLLVFRLIWTCFVNL